MVNVLGVLNSCENMSHRQALEESKGAFIVTIEGKLKEKAKGNDQARGEAKGDKKKERARAKRGKV
jgi:hypothetical protein